MDGVRLSNRVLMDCEMLALHTGRSPRVIRAHCAPVIRWQRRHYYDAVVCEQILREIPQLNRVTEAA